MTFLLSKFVWGLAGPGVLLLLMVLLGFVLVHRAPRLSRAMLGLALLFMAALLLTPLGQWAIRPLEQRFPEPALPAHVDGIVVLGGASGYDSESPSGLFLNAAAERLTSFAALARRYPQARLVFSGGSGSVRDTDHREADFAVPFLESLGVPRSRLILERDSRNTWENAVYSHAEAQPKDGETWLLITSAWHMPRSVGCFRRAGWQVLPYPVDFRGHDPEWWGFDLPRQIDTLAVAEREWIGLVAYHWLRRSPEWFPKPQTAP